MPSKLKTDTVKWDRRLLGLARTYSTFSKDPSTKVGAVVAVQHKYVLGLGYNGFPKGHDDSHDNYNCRTYKYANIVHAEINAYNVARVHGLSQFLRWSCVVYPLLPCTACAEVLAANWCERVVTTDLCPPRWKDDQERSLKLFEECGIKVVRYPANSAVIP